MEWTAEELKEFERLCTLASSPNQVHRIKSRTRMPKFIEQHGKEKCDAMFAHLQKKWDCKDRRNK